MRTDAEHARERAYRFDLVIATDWCERFDILLGEHLKLPAKGRFLEINCGTGSSVIARASGGADVEVVGTDEDGERITIARSKAEAAAGASEFHVSSPDDLKLESGCFDAVILDATLEEPARLGPMVAEAVRVAREGAPVAVKTVLRGSFDEFFSLYWEAVHNAGLDDTVWAGLERLITRRPTLHEVIQALRSAHVKGATPHRSKEEWRFQSGKEFLSSPLVTDLFLAEWVAILPEERRADVMRDLASIVDREVDGHYFDVSVHAAVFVGHK